MTKLIRTSLFLTLTAIFLPFCPNSPNFFPFTGRLNFLTDGTLKVAKAMTEVCKSGVNS